MLIPNKTPPPPINIVELERQTVVEARVLRAVGGSDTGPHTSSADIARLQADCLAILPFCSITEARDFGALTKRLIDHASTLPDLVGDHYCRLSMRLHLAVLDQGLLPEEIKKLIGTVITSVAFAKDGLVHLASSYRHMVALSWLSYCLEIKLHELTVRELGDSAWANADRYREILHNRTSEPEMRAQYRGELRKMLERRTSDLARMDPELLSLGMTNQVIDLGALAAVAGFGLRDTLRAVEISRGAQLHRLEMVVDEGVAEWSGKYHSAQVHSDIQPILPVTPDLSSVRPPLSSTNPYRRGLEMAQTIERKLGPAFVRLAAQVACAYARVLQFELTVGQLKTIQETAPWHPTARFQRIAQLTAEETQKVLSAPPATRAIALFAVVDASKPTPSQYARDLIGG